MEFSRPSDSASFANPTDRFWSLYLAEAQVQDKQRVDRWKGDADGILIFTGLFAATVATFVVSSYPKLSPDSGDQTVALLTGIAALLANGTQAAASDALLSHRAASDSGPGLAVVCVNTLWFLSLIVAVFGALLATLVQQWSRQYSQNIQRPGSPSVLGPIHLFISTGVDHFMMEDAIGVIASLVHLAVSLFSVGLLVFLYDANHAIAWFAIAAVSLGASCYFLLSILPLIYPDSPYRTPFTIWLRLAMAVSSIAYIATCESLTHVALYWRALRNELRDVPLTTSATGVKEGFKSRIGSKMRSGLAEIKEMARTPGARQIFKAIETVWQNADEAHEIERFCIAVQPLLSYPSKPEESAQKEVDERTLSSLLLMKTDIVARVHRLISSTRSLPRTVSEADYNHRLYVGYTFLRSLLKEHLSTTDPESLQYSVSEAFAMLSMELATFTLTFEPTTSHYISTFFLARCFAFALPDIRVYRMDTRGLEAHLKQHRPEAHADELMTCAHSHKGSVPGILSDMKETLVFLEDKRIEMPVLRIGRVLDCAHCRLVSVVTFILEFGTSSLWATKTLTDWVHAWKPIVQYLCHETGIWDPGHDQKPSSNHLSHYLIAHLLHKMGGEQWRGPDCIDANQTPTGEFPWKVSHEYSQFLSQYPELRSLIRAFIRYFQQSQVASMPMEDIRRKLSPLKRGGPYTDPSGSPSSESAMFGRRPTLSGTGRRWSGIKRALNVSRGMRTDNTSDSSGAMLSQDAGTEQDVATSMASPSTAHSPNESTTPRLRDAGDSVSFSSPTMMAMTPSGQSDFSEYMADDSRSYPSSPTAASIIAMSNAMSPHRPGTTTASTTPSTASQHDQRPRLSAGLSRIAHKGQNRLHSLPEKDETHGWKRWLLPARTASSTLPSATPTTAAPISAHESSTRHMPSDGEDTALRTPPPTDHHGENLVTNGNTPHREDSEDIESESQQTIRFHRLRFLRSPSRAASAENRRAHADILEAAQSIQTMRFLDYEEEYTDEPRQML